jgi:hypothetical protein
MGDIVNLRRIKKLRGRDAKKQDAAENRIRFGRSASQPTTDRLEGVRETVELDGKRLHDETKG